MSEYDLLKAFREERSETAFAELVRRYAGLVYSVAKRRLANAALAEDITQMVFIRFAQTPPKLQTQTELAAWLHRTTVNVTIDTWRSETRRRHREEQAIIMDPTPAEDTIWEELAPNLDEALNQLNNDDRHALILRYFDRKAMRDVGAALGVSEDAAKMRVSRALGRMRTQLGVGSAACTAAVLESILDERSVQAAPVQLVSRLAAIKLPRVAARAGMIGLLGGLLPTSKLTLAAVAVVLAVIGVSLVHFAGPSAAPASLTETTNSQTKPTGTPVGIATRARLGASGFNPSLEARPRPVKMLFHVLEAETGDGLADTKIHAAYFGPGGIGEGHDLLTDGNGMAPIPEPDDPAKGQGLNIFVVAEEHVPKAVDFPRGEIPADYTMKLDPAITTGGLVVDEHGQPVPGVIITIQGPGNQRGKMENMDFQTCPVTDHNDGSWSCSYVPKDYTDEIYFRLQKQGYAATFAGLPANHLDLTNLVLVIKRGFTVTGQITDLENRPIVKARIKSLDGDFNTRQSAKTDETGVFVLIGLLGETEVDGQVPLHVKLAVQADGFAPQTTTVALASPTNVINFTLAKGNIFRGRVVDETGNPIANAVVRTDYDFKNQIATQFDWLTHTDGHGWFEWDSAPAEEICYWFEADGCTVIRGRPLLADGSDHEITLKRDATK
jgi:RNA polymerase sigma factor (sigma-70 family)